MAKVYVWLSTMLASLGGLMYSYEISSTNGVKEMEGFRQTFNISYPQSDALNQTTGVSVDDVETSALLGAIVSVFSIGALVGALLSGLLSDLAGRKVTLIVGGSLFTFGGALQSFSFFLWMLFPGRIIGGIGTGISWQACMLYIAEIAPKERRGVMIAMANAIGGTGLVAGIVISIIVERYTFGWRVAISIEILIGLVLTLCALFLHETPRFLVKKQKVAKALKVLIKIRKDHTKAQSELTEIQSSVRNSRSRESWLQTIKYFCSGSILQRVFIGFFLMLMTRLTGAPVIVYYSVSIFSKVGVDGFIGSLVLFVCMFIVQIIGLLAINKFGRKTILLLGFVAISILLVTAGIMAQLFDLEGNADLNGSQKIAGYFVIISICLQMSIYVFSYAAITWIVINEIYPLRIRGIGAALSQLGWWGGTVLMGQVGPILLSSPLRTPGTFYLFAGTFVLVFLHVLLLLPETKGRSLESIEHLFTMPWSKRVDIVYYLSCGCFCCSRRTRMELVPTLTENENMNNELSESEEREQLQEPLDQISLSSIDSIEPDDEHRTTETTV